MTDEKLQSAITKAQKVADHQALNLSTLLHVIEQGKVMLSGHEPRASRQWVEHTLQFPRSLFVDNVSDRFSNVSSDVLQTGRDDR